METLEETEKEELQRSRNKFNNAYPAYGFTGIEHENNVYDKVLNQCRKDFEPKYKEEFDKQYNLVYYTLRENVIASIHGEIKAAYRHKKRSTVCLRRSSSQIVSTRLISYRLRMKMDSSMRCLQHLN